MILKRLALVFALVIACATPAFAQKTEAVRPALFVARDADSALYLFGTVHIRRAGTPWGGPRAQAALAEADEVWTEIEMDAGADADAQRLVASLGMAAPDQPLSSWLNAEENARLAALAERLGAPMAMLEPMQPWFAAITLSVLPMMQAGYDPSAGVDRGVDAAADAAGKRRRALETVGEQLGFMANLSDEAQRQMLLDAIDESEGGPAQIESMISAWSRGDVSALARLVVTDTRKNYPELYDVLFVRRNNRWMDVLMAELDGAGVDFVAVGAGHVVGDDGLVAQLRARGVRVERVE